MCAHFQFGRPAEDVAAALGATIAEPLPVPGDFFPGRQIPVALSAAGGRVLRAARWGLIPRHYTSQTQQPQPTNARAESVARLDVFRDSFAARRCLIPGTGFFEWTRTTPKVRYKLTPTGGVVCAFAGLWDEWRVGDEFTLLSATMVTTKPNALIGAFHDRMPVILPAAAHAEWLDPATPPKRVKELLASYPSEAMVCEEAPPPTRGRKAKPAAVKPARRGSAKGLWDE